MHSRLKAVVATAIASAALLAAAAPAAQADSIAYVKDGNIWLSTSDGARQYQVTTAGGYSTVSQDKYGDMIATHGTRLHWLGRDGVVRADFYTPVSTGPGAQSGGDGRQWYGPFDPKLSPDGRKVAYHWYYRQIDGGCLPEFQTVCVYMRQGTGYSKPDQITSLDDPQFKSQTGWIYPTWTTDGDATVLSDPSPAIGNEDLVIHTPYPFEGTDGLARWANEPDVQLHDGEFDPTHRKMAYVAGDNHERLRIYRTPEGLYPYFPRGCYEFGNPVGGRFDGPSWSPDGSRLAFAQGDGIYIADVPALTLDPCNQGATEPRMLIPGGSSADWGPADVPAARAPVTPPDAPRTPGGRTPAGRAPSKTTATLAAKPATKQALASRGVALKVSCAKTCKVSASIRLGARRLGAGSVRLKGAGTRTLTVKVAKAQRARLLKARRPRLRVQVTIAPLGGGKTVTKTISLPLK
ncbi:MAG TPA: hypothetical protein VLK58_09625 [Conexibacter sp.]|nr:hypothetical protein [Conexibacter sp.]